MSTSELPISCRSATFMMGFFSRNSLRKTATMKVKVFFALYDFWIGAYLDVKNRILYMCPIPCVVIRISKR
jgi:hypothetical protein